MLLYQLRRYHKIKNYNFRTCTDSSRKISQYYIEGKVCGNEMRVLPLRQGVKEIIDLT